MAEPTSRAERWLRPLPPTGPWALESACRGADPGQFFPGPRYDEVAARALCATCPVRLDCREYALGVPGIGGIWGGTDEADRRALRRRARGLPLRERDRRRAARLDGSPVPKRTSQQVARDRVELT